MKAMLESEKTIRLPLTLELERRTSARRLAAKLERFCGFYRRMLLHEETCALRPVLVVHHDPRSRVGGEHRPGSGAEALRAKVRERLLATRRTDADPAHYCTLDDRLWEMDPTLDVGRLIVLADWRDVRSLDFSAPLYPVSPYPVGHGDETSGDETSGSGMKWTVGFREVAEEWDYAVRAIQKGLDQKGDS